MQRVFGVAGYSGSGKTTLLERLIPRLVSHGLKVSLVKHAHHAFDIDHPGKDSFRLREAGCGEIMLASEKRWALMHELGAVAEPPLEQLLSRMSPCDLVLVEGFKSGPFEKLEVHRPSTQTPPLFASDASIVAVASDVKLETKLPVFDLAEVEPIAAFILQRVGLSPPR